MNELLLPTDGCPNCLDGKPVHPHHVEPDGTGTGLRAWYRCPKCLLSWWTGFAIDAAELPCPGCDACHARSA